MTKKQVEYTENRILGILQKIEKLEDRVLKFEALGQNLHKATAEKALRDCRIELASLGDYLVVCLGYCYRAHIGDDGYTSSVSLERR